MADQTHEYMVVELEHHGSTKDPIGAQWTRQLNRLAAEGWRLFSIIEQRAAVFERPVERPSIPPDLSGRPHPDVP